MGEFRLSSDAVVPCFTRNRKVQQVITEIPQQDLDWFNSIAYTMGGMMLWPGNRVDNKMTINAARGCSDKIKDRFDLAIECVARYYGGAASPLTDVFNRYSAFFSLFCDFRGFVDFFLLQDLVASDTGTVDLFLPNDDFSTSPLPQSQSEYLDYMSKAIAFLEARNRRIDRYCLNRAPCLCPVAPPGLAVARAALSAAGPAPVRHIALTC